MTGKNGLPFTSKARLTFIVTVSIGSSFWALADDAIARQAKKHSTIRLAVMLFLSIAVLRAIAGFRLGVLELQWLSIILHRRQKATAAGNELRLENRWNHWNLTADGGIMGHMARRGRTCKGISKP